jgi:two-component system cell cycle response regulator
MLASNPDTPDQPQFSAEPRRILRVLVVDDSAVYRALIKRVLSLDLFDVRFAASKTEGISLYETFSPELVLTDWMLPDGTGLELCQHIRKTSQAPYCYLVVLTAQSEKDNVVHALSAGADDYLTKPFHEGEMLARLSAGRRILDLQRELHAKNKLLEQLALTDPLTGLPNRRAIEQIATSAMSSAARHGFAVWLAIADLDRFKTVNDSYGHEIGDQVLRRFADVLRANTRQSNNCGRLGGEEFVILLSHANANGVSLALERIRTQFAGQMFATANREFQATASFGVAQMIPGEGLLDLLARADRALYRAKANGRDRIEHSIE